MYFELDLLNFCFDVSSLLACLVPGVNKESEQIGICIATREQLHLQVLSCRQWCEGGKNPAQLSVPRTGTHGDGECWGEDGGQCEAVRVLGQAHSHGCAEQVLAAAL